MPIYEYRCDQCDHVFEVLQKRDAPAPEACPACSALGPKKQVTASAFHLKGGGWYVTDFKGKEKSSQDKTGGSNSEKSREGTKDATSSGASTPASSSTAKKTDTGDASTS